MLDPTAGQTPELSAAPAASSKVRWLAALIAASAVLRLWLGWHFFGFLTGDDVEILEFGFHRALGLEYIPWEIRNTLVSDLLVAPAVWLGHVVGITDVRLLCWVATWPFVALSLVSIWLLSVVVERWSDDVPLALTAAAFYAAQWLPTGFSASVYPRTASTTCVLAAVALLGARRRKGGTAILAGALLALACAIRYSEIIFVVPVLALLAIDGRGRDERGRRSFRLAGLTAGFGAGSIAFLALDDLAVWGKPFASLDAFARYVLVERGSSSQVAVQSAGWYLWRLPHWLSPLAWPFLAFAFGSRVARRALPFVVAPVLLLSLVHHKELRYLQGLVPFASALVAAGAVDLWRRGRRRATVALGLLLLTWNVVELRYLGRKSAASVLAAERAAADPHLRTFAAAQLWAYGDRLVLGNGVAVRDIPYPDTTPEALVRMATGADRVALYEASLAAEPRLERTLARLGFCRQELFAWARSKPVQVFAPCSAPPPALR